MPDFIRKDITGVACNKKGRDTRKIHFYVVDECPISLENCKFWQEQEGYPPRFFGIQNVVIRKRKRGGFQATWCCNFQVRSAIPSLSPKGMVVKEINHQKASKNHKKKKNNLNKKKKEKKITKILKKFSLFDVKC